MDIRIPFLCMFVIFIMDSSSDYTDYDQFQETMDDEVETQHEEADDIINANDTISDTSQRELRYDHHQTKQKLIHEDMRQADHHQTKLKIILEAMRQADHLQRKQKIMTKVKNFCSYWEAKYQPQCIVTLDYFQEGICDLHTATSIIRQWNMCTPISKLFEIFHYTPVVIDAIVGQTRPVALRYMSDYMSDHVIAKLMALNVRTIQKLCKN